MEITVRKARMSDAEDLARLYIEFWKPHKKCDPLLEFKEKLTIRVILIKGNRIYEDDPLLRLQINTLGYLIASDLGNKGRSDIILYYPREPKLWSKIKLLLNR